MGINKSAELIKGTPVNHRYRQLDSLRGIAALTVFLGHYSGLKLHIGIYDWIRPTPFGALLNGNAAVMFFFLLSGFVLSLPYIDNQRPLKVGEFYIKRFFRIFPAFIFAITLSVLMKEFVFDKAAMAPFSGWMQSFWTWQLNNENIHELLKTLLLIGPLFKKSLIDPVIWSLVIEVGMSLVVPFFIKLAARGNVLYNITLFVLATSLTCRGDYWAFPIFHMGILLAKYRMPLSAWVAKWNRFYLVAVLLVALFLYNNLYEFLDFFQKFGWPYKFVWSNYAAAIGSCTVIIVALSRQSVTRLLERRILIFFGDISYSFYLIHLPVMITAASLFSYYSPFSLLYIFLATFSISVLISYLMFIYIEMPFRQFGALVVKRLRHLKVNEELPITA